MGDNQHGTTHATDTGGALNDLQGGAQRVARGAERTRNLAVGIAGLDNHATQIKIVFGHQLAGLVHGHALFLAQFGQHCGILLRLLAVPRIHDGGLVKMGQAPSLGLFPDILRVADENQVGQIVGQYLIRCLQCAFFLCFGKHDALLVSLSTRHNLF